MAEAVPSHNEVVQYVERDHSWPKCIFICTGISMCITVDILQYSMPLAFLPSVLEDRGHEAFEIATAIGVYYWTGFLGCSIIMLFQVYRMLYQRQSTSDVTDYATVQRHIKYLIAGLGVGAITLSLQALYPTLVMHTSCRFLQGFAGAFIFFYTALLNVALFKGRQQDVAVTFGSCALNVAEVFGSFLGAVLFDIWGQRSVFWFLGVVSIVNQFLLIAVMYMINPAQTPTRPPLSRHNTPLGSGGFSRSNTPLRGPSRQNSTASGVGQIPVVDDRMRLPLPQIPSGDLATADPDAGAGPAQPLDKRTCCGLRQPQPGSVEKLRQVFSNRGLLCSVLLIAMSAVVKGAVEEMLPFHADHRWGYNPMQIGRLFCTVAIAYILAATLVCNIWEWLENFQVAFSAYWLLMLGIVAWGLFAVVTLFESATYLSAALVLYGICLGCTHTPANLLAAAVIDVEVGAAKDASNGIFQTMWEAGGSLGFLLGGLLAERYHEQMGLLTCCAIGCVIFALIMMSIWTWPEEGCDCIRDDSDNKLETCSEKDYGSTATA